MSKTYGYGDFSTIRSKSIVFDSFGDYFYEGLLYQTVADPKWKIMMRKT
jgi:hypothetical protein